MRHTGDAQQGSSSLGEETAGERDNPQQHVVQRLLCLQIVWLMIQHVAGMFCDPHPGSTLNLINARFEAALSCRAKPNGPGQTLLQT